MIAIVTDSTCDIPQPLVEQFGIIVVPNIIIWGEEQFRDRVDMQPEEFYRRLENDPTHPGTSQAGIPDFERAYEQAAGRGADEVLAITVSSAMSGVHQMALAAVEHAPVPVTVVDSRGPTMSLGWQVLAAARALAEGGGLQDAVQRAAEVRRRLALLVALNTIEYFQRGGRVGEAVSWVGGLLQVKPLIRINHHKGIVEPVTLARTQKSLVETMYRKFFEAMPPGKKLHVAVLHGNAREKAEELAERIRAEFNPAELLVHMTGPALGVHTGPAALALSGYTDD